MNRARIRSGVFQLPVRVRALLGLSIGALLGGCTGVPEGYEYSMVTGDDRSYLWILAREPELEQVTLDRLVARAAELGFATEDLIYVEHGQMDLPPGP